MRLALSRARAQLSYIIAARLLTLVGQLGYVKLYSNLLRHDELGVLFFLLSIVSGFMSLIYYPVDQYQQAHLYEYRKNGISLRSFLPMNIQLFAGVSVLVAAGMLGWYLLDGVVHFELFVCFFVAQATHIVTAVRNLLNNLEFKITAAAFFAAEAVCKVSVLGLMALFVAVTPTHVMWTVFVALSAIGVGVTWAASRRNLFPPQRIFPVRWQDLLLFCGPIAGGAILTVVQLQGFRFLAPFGFAETIGVYATVASVGGSAVLAVSPILIQMYQPENFKSNGAFTPTYLLYALGLIVIVAIGVIIFAVPVVRILTNASFVPYAHVALFGVGVEGGNLLLGGMAPFFNLRKRTSVFFAAGVIGMVVSVSVLWFFMRQGTLTPYEIGTAVVVSQLAAFLYMFAVYKRMVASEVVAASG